MFKQIKKTTKKTLRKTDEIIDIAGDAVVEWTGVAVEIGSLTKKVASLANSKTDLILDEIKLDHKFDLLRAKFGLKKKELRAILKENGLSLDQKDLDDKVSKALLKIKK